jgi:hypothetical protein
MVSLAEKPQTQGMGQLKSTKEEANMDFQRTHTSVSEELRTRRTRGGWLICDGATVPRKAGERELDSSVRRRRGELEGKLEQQTHNLVPVQTQSKTHQQRHKVVF